MLEFIETELASQFRTKKFSHRFAAAAVATKLRYYEKTNWNSCKAQGRWNSDRRKIIHVVTQVKNTTM